MPRSKTSGNGSRMRLIVCVDPSCTFTTRATRGAVAKVGRCPTCGCGAPMTFDDIEDVLAVFGPDAIVEHPSYVAEMDRWAGQALREATTGGHQRRCGGCQRYIRRVNEECGCGFHNDIRGNRNHGRWVEGASFCKQARDEMPF